MIDTEPHNNITELKTIGLCIDETFAINPYSVKELCDNEHQVGLLRGLMNYALTRFVKKIKDQL